MLYFIYDTTQISKYMNNVSGFSFKQYITASLAVYLETKSLIIDIHYSHYRLFFNIYRHYYGS